MGGAQSNVQNNDEMVEYLLQNCYVHRKKIELVFRAVDRADYVLSSHQESAYNDLAWKHGNLHLSAPCVYGVAMEYLSLEPGQSFLNIGSGTGYFSTMAGLLLGPYGVNHGIELHEDCVQYARDRLEHFKQHSRALEEFDFCEPSFVQGNCLLVVPAREYDTVYCGAAVSENYIPAVKRFVKIGGSIMIPYKGRLCFFTRLTETSWACKKTLGVSFASLVTPDPSDQSTVTLPDSDPLSLQELCRSRVRQILRQNVWKEHPTLERRNLSLLDQQPRTDPFSDSSDDVVSEENEDEDEDEDEEGEDDSDEDDDETDGHIIRRTRFLFNMEVDYNDTPRNPVRLSRIAMLVGQSRNAERQEIENSLDRFLEDIRNDEPAVAAASLSPDVAPQQDGSSGTTANENAEASPNLALNLSLNEPQVSQHRSSSRLVRKCGSSTNAKSTRDSDSKRESACDSDEEFVTQWRKIAKRENTDSGIVDDVNIPSDDTSSSSNMNNSNSDEDDEDDDDDDEEDSDYVESRLFVTYMKEKILRLPLPTKLKLYMNHNRSL